MTTTRVTELTEQTSVDGTEVVAVEHTDSPKKITTSTLLSGGTSGHFGSLMPINVSASDVTAFAGNIATDPYTDVLTRWDAEFTSGTRVNGLSVNKRDIGPSTVDYDSIYSYEFAPDGYTHTILVVGGFHGNEKESSISMLEVAKVWTGSKASVRANRGSTRVCFIPVANPDGYDLNTRTNANPIKAVDLNRNWDPVAGSRFAGKWDTYTDNGDNTRYKGASAFSEQETINLKTLIDTTYDDLTVLLDFQNYVLQGTQYSVYVPPADDGTLTGCINWAAYVTWGDSRDGWLDDGTSETETVSTPLPGMALYTQSIGKWGITPEFGANDLDITTAAGMAEAVSFQVNSISATAQVPDRSAYDFFQPRAWSQYMEASKALSNTQTSWVELPEFTLNSPINVPGYVTMNISLECYPGGASGSLLWFRPRLGQNVSAISDDGDGQLRLAEERYVSGGTSKRSVISLTAMRFVMPSRETTTANGSEYLNIGLEYKVSGTVSGTPVLNRAKIDCTFTPVFGGGCYELYDCVAGSAPSKRFPSSE